MVDPVKLAAEVHDLLGPQRAQDGDLLGAAAAAVVKGLVQGLELDGVPAHADSEAQPAAAQHVDLGRLLGHQRRLPLREDEDAGGQREPAGDGREVGHQRQRFVDHGLVRVRGERWMGMEPGIGAQDVVGHEEMVEAHRLDVPDEPTDRLDVGPALRLGEDHADFHESRVAAYPFSMTSICTPSGASRKQTRRPLVGGSSSRMRTPLFRSRASVPG